MRRRPVRVESIIGVSALIALLAAPSIARAQSTLDMPIDTGTTAGSAPAPSTPPSRNASALPSRSMPNYGTGFRQAQPLAAPAPQVLAQLGTVTVNEAAIRLTRDTNARALSLVPKGTNLAVVADGGTWWGVLMVNNTMGWIPKSSLQMMDYQTQIDVPATPTAAPEGTETLPQAQSTGGSSVDNALANSGLDARTTGLLREAFSYLGVPYVWAGNTRSGLDCSGFVCNVFSGALGIHLPRHSGDQAKVGLPVRGDDLRPGDRLYFDMGNRGEISHCGIYLGNGYFIHASTNHKSVAVDSLLKPNYRRALVAARRS